MIPKMSAVGMAEAVYNAVKEGRKPTKDEMIKGASTGAAYGTLFAILPVLKEASDIKGKSALDKLGDTIQKVMDDHHVSIEGEQPIEIKGTDAIKQDIRETLSDENVSDQHKKVLDTLTNYETSEDPRTGEQIPSGEREGKTIVGRDKELIKNYWSEKNKTQPLEFDFLKKPFRTPRSPSINLTAFL